MTNIAPPRLEAGRKSIGWDNLRMIAQHVTEGLRHPKQSIRIAARLWNGKSCDPDIAASVRSSSNVTDG